ncbi:MAG: flagellar basal body-associated FliL family protein [Pseudomonadota bacterium]|nr:flagellar basal body-associated FliL family protein [Pseudomonadota bacterium]
MSTLIEWIVVTLIAGGAGFALTAMNPVQTGPETSAADKPPPGKLAPEKRESEKKDVAAACAPGGPSMIDLPPIITNIANPADTWVRLEGSIVFDPKAVPHPEVVAAEIATDEMAYLHTVTINQLQGPIGLENIRQDLRDRAMVRSNGKVTDLLLKTLVLQ